MEEVESLPYIFQELLSGFYQVNNVENPPLRG
jgi:hypothetical protein